MTPLRFAQQDREQRGLPVVAVDDIRLQIRDIAGKPAIAKTLRLSELKPGATPDVERR